VERRVLRVDSGMPKKTQTSLPTLQGRGFLAGIGGRAGFAVAAIGLVFAAYQVQGWTMPRPLAVVLITALLAVAAPELDRS